MTTQEQTTRGALPLAARLEKPPPWRLMAAGATILTIALVSFWLAINPQWVMRLGHWGYVGAFLISLFASATIILPAPGIAVVIAMSAALDPIPLGIVAGLGSAVGELSGYIAGASGRALVPDRQRAQVERLHALTNRYGALLIFVLAAVPFPLFDFAGIVAGMLRMNVAAFIAGAGLGKSIKYILMIWLGAGPLYILQHLPQLLGGGR
jgi:membrane protein YqaA with SNARE-associated domain